MDFILLLKKKIQKKYISLFASGQRGTEKTFFLKKIFLT